MNILIFVITLLMMLSLMTYARLDVYRGSQTFQLLFSDYMEEGERNYINQKAEKKYPTIGVSPKKKPNDPKTPTPKVAATSRINISALLPNKKEDEAYAQKQQQAATLLKNLMVVLYADQPFFQKAQQTRPTFMDDIVRGIISTIADLPEKQKIKSAKDLANLELADLELNEIFYKMLHGAPCKNENALKEEQNGMVPQEAKEEADETDQNDQSMLAAEAEEFQSPKGYCSLLGFITISPGDKVRIYLAPREVLKAIYPNNIVEEIMKERQALHKEATADEKGSNKDSLKETFRNMFDRYKDALIDENTLDYSVSKTKPPK